LRYLQATGQSIAANAFSARVAQQFYLTGLTPGALQLDLSYLVTKGGGNTGSGYAFVAGNAVNSVGPAIIQVFDAT